MLIADLQHGDLSVAHINGDRVCISVDNSNDFWPDGVRLAFVRSHREPTLVFRSPRVSRLGSARLYCWVPKGAVSLKLVARDGSPYRGSDLTIVKIRHVSLLELGIRVGFNTPQKMLSVFRLIASGNRKGESFRFARAADELNALPYGRWLRMHQKQAPEVPEPREPLDNLKVVVTVEAGSELQTAKTLASLDCQSWTAWETVEREKLNEFRTRREGQRLLWLNLPAGSVLENNALVHLAQPFSSSSVAMVYSDEDIIDRGGRRHSPMLKPAWSPLLAQSRWMPLDGALVDLAMIPPEIDLRTADVNDTAIKIAAFSRRAIVHLPQVLLSRERERPQSHPPVKPPVGVRLPMVSVIIPTRDRLDLLEACITGLKTKTAGIQMEIIVVDNDSQEKTTLEYLSRLVREQDARVISMPGKFNFAQACNRAVELATHDTILLLNNDVTPIADDWLVQMVQELADPSIGAVGAYLFYPDGLVQHAGVTLGAGSVARHSFAFIHPASGEDRGLLVERRDVSAVTAACMLTTRSLWRSVGGMDEEKLAVAFNDVDYCLKLRRIQRRIIWTPFAKLWHHESVSRGKDNTKEKLQRFADEEATMHLRWGRWLKNDPFHNPNLSKVAEDFVLEAFPVSLAPRTSNWD